MNFLNIRNMSLAQLFFFTLIFYNSRFNWCPLKNFCDIFLIKFLHLLFSDEVSSNASNSHRVSPHKFSSFFSLSVFSKIFQNCMVLFVLFHLFFMFIFFLLRLIFLYFVFFLLLPWFRVQPVLWWPPKPCLAWCRQRPDQQVALLSKQKVLKGY